MKKKIAFLLAAAVICISLFAVPSFADFGDFSGGSDFDFGGYDSSDSWGGSSDWGNSDWGGSSYYDGDNNYYYSGGSSVGGGGIGVVDIAIIVVVIAIIALNYKNIAGAAGKKKVNLQRPNVNTANMVNDLAALKQKDPAFNESRFLEDVSNLYVRIQNAWTDKNLDSVRNKLSSELTAKTERQIDTYKKNGVTNHIDKISVLGTNIIGCTNDNLNDIITVQITARITDYVTNDKTGELVKGDPNKELFMTYHWTMIRSLGKQTQVASEDVDKKNCPNCGAPVDLNQSTVCPYCGSVLESGDYDWILSNIQAISQQTA